MRFQDHAGGQGTVSFLEPGRNALEVKAFHDFSTFFAKQWGSIVCADRDAAEPAMVARTGKCVYRLTRTISTGTF